MSILTSESTVSIGLNDFYHIEDWTVETHNAAHTEDLAWLNEQVASISISDPGRMVIIFTHHSPITRDARAVDPNHAGSAISSGFASDLIGEECWKNATVCLWAFGHTHFNCGFTVKEDEGRKKRLVANQRGYYFKQAVDFDAEKVVSV